MTGRHAYKHAAPDLGRSLVREEAKLERPPRHLEDYHNESHDWSWEDEDAGIVWCPDCRDEVHIYG